VVKQLFRYAAGRSETRDDRRILEHATKEFRDSGYRFRNLMVSLIKYLVYPPAGD